MRLDGADTERTHVDLREAYWRGIFGDWEILVEVNVVFTESRHLVNIINQTDFLEDIDEENKLGQPMVSVEWQRSWGRISGFLLLGFREQRFPGREGRLRLPLPVDYAATRFPDGKRPVDFALRYSHFFGDFDVGVYFFHGTGRETCERGRRSPRWHGCRARRGRTSVDERVQHGDRSEDLRERGSNETLDPGEPRQLREPQAHVFLLSRICRTLARASNLKVRPTMKIRRARPEDAAGIQTVHAQSVGGMGSEEYPDDVLTEWGTPRAAEDYAEVFLDSSLNAVPFYEAVGFEVIERREYRLSSGREMDSIRMRKELDR